MLKAFLDSRHAEDVAFWEKYFSVQSFEYLVRSFDCDPIRPLIERYCSGGALVLEGGCGLGNYVACLRRIGSRPVGLDFGFSMLSEFKRIEPASLLTAGDVSALPFRDGVFDVYYSGGVVEHFEGGPGCALAEAHRVLKRGGIFLVSVPYENLIRRVRAPVNGEGRGFVVRPVAREERGPAPPGSTFFQYFYRPEEFRRALEQHRFEVVEELPYSLWRGLTDIGLFRWVDDLYAGRRSGAGDFKSAALPSLSASPIGARGASAPFLARAKAALKWLIFAEDRSVPGLGAAIAVLCALAANMRMYVCRGL